MRILSYAEISTFYKWNIWARPVLTYSLTIVLISISITACSMLLLGYATMNETSGLLMTIVGVIAPILTGVVLGRSYEKAKGVVDPALEQVQGEKEEGSDYFPPTPHPATDDPFAILNSMPLEDYLPKLADDRPQI